VRNLIVLRGIFAALYIGAGAIIVAEMLLIAPHAGSRIVVGAVLGIAMIALGVHRLVLIRRMRSNA
jgi:phosphate/sulfate permease